MISVLLALSVLGATLENSSWFLSLGSQFQEWWIALSIGLLLFVPWVTKYRGALAIICLFSVAFHAWDVWPYWSPFFSQSPSGKSTKSIDIFFANLNSQNKNKNLLSHYLTKNQPELVFLVEVNPSWAKRIKDLEPIYPYSKAIVREGNFGMAVLSKEPIELINVFFDRENMIPSLFVKSQTSLGPINLALLHAHPPIGAYGTLIRDQYIDSLSHRIHDLAAPTIVCGDFNTVPWTPVFEQFLSRSGLKYQKNSLPPNTWPSIFFLPGLPIDHCLSKGLSFVSYKKGPDVGSDHWPLEVRVSAISKKPDQ